MHSDLDKMFEGLRIPMKAICEYILNNKKDFCWEKYYEDDQEASLLFKVNGQVVDMIVRKDVPDWRQNSLGVYVHTITINGTYLCLTHRERMLIEAAFYIDVDNYV